MEVQESNETGAFWKINQENGEIELDPGPLTVQFYCNICKSDVSVGNFRIRCAECEDFDLCYDCFMKGREKGSHSNDHSYCPYGPNRFELYDSGWTADEELYLLEGISLYGFGNWDQVAELVNRVSKDYKSKRNCEIHYYKIYVKDFRRINCKDEEAKNKILGFPELNIKKEQKDCSLKLNAHESTIYMSHPNFIPPPPPNSLDLQIHGYMNLRGDFDTEHDNDAELLICNMEFFDTDLPAEKDLKLKIIEVYNSRLDERIYRKRMILNRQWTDWRSFICKDKQVSKDEKKLLELTKCLMRFHSDLDQKMFVKLILLEKELEERRKVLTEWKSLNLQTIDQVKEYESKKVHYQNWNTNNTHKEIGRKNIEKFEKYDNCIKSHNNIEENTILTTINDQENPIIDSILSPIEKSFCSTLNLSFASYLILKNIINNQVQKEKLISTGDNKICHYWTGNNTSVMDLEVKLTYNKFKQ